MAKAYYASASYEDALAHLTSVDPATLSAETEQYRALCLLALARTEEAQQAFDRVVELAPLYVIPESDVSPRVVAMFRDARRRVLPAVVRAQYAKGKASVDEKRYTSAVTELRAVLQLLGDVDLASQADAFADLRQLADGFLGLSELELELAEREVASLPVAAPAGVALTVPAPAADQVVVTKIVVYSSGDPGVTPPVELERFVPPWNPPAVIARSAAYRGTMDVVVNEAGRVEVATMTRPTFPPYDVTLIGATRRWRFEPAVRDGAPVKYHLVFEIELAPGR